MSVLPNNLPVQTTSFIGREKEMAAVTEMLTGRTRLLTLVGTGGTGKTRLAVEAGASLIGFFRGGVWLVELAMVANAGRILAAMTAVFGVREEPGRPLRDTLFDALSGKEMLVIFDNCEQVSGSIASLVADLLKSCEGLKVVATSRNSLGIAGEATFPVPPLGILDIHRERLEGHGLAKRLREFDAVKLFVERAAAMRPDFLLTDENAPHVAEICGRLDGIPLAIELAAARLKLLDVRQIAERLEDRFRLLRGGGADRLPHQQTLQALIDWSHDLLTDSERVLLRRLGVFVGGRNLEAIEKVCAGGEVEEFDVLDLLQGLVDKSLVAVETRRSEDPRYTMLESVWHYARSKLRESGEEGDLRERHMRFFLEWAEVAEPEFEGPNQGRWLAKFDDDLFNLDSAMRYCIREKLAEEGYRLVSALGRPLEVRGYLTEARESLEALLALPAEVTDELRARTLACAGRIAWAVDQYDEARRFFTEAEAFAQKAQQPCLAGFCRGFVGFLERGDGHTSAAEARFREGVAVAEQHSNERLRAMCMSGLGRVAADRGDLTEARRLAEEAASVYRTLGDHWILGLILWGVARTAIRQGDLARAEEALCEWAGIAKALGNAWTMPYILQTFASVAIASGEYEKAARMMGAAEQLRERFGFRLSASEAVEQETELEALRTRLAPEQLRDLWQQGHEGDPEAMIHEARGRICPRRAKEFAFAQ